MNQSVNNMERASRGMPVTAAMDGSTAPWGGQTMELFSFKEQIDRFFESFPNSFVIALWNHAYSLP